MPGPDCDILDHVDLTTGPNASKLWEIGPEDGRS